MKFKPRFRDDNVKFKAKFATSDSVIKPLDVTENGDYTVPNGVDGFNPIKVNVPLPDGFIKPEGTINITQDGEWDVRNFEKANVNASGAVGEQLTALLNGTLTEFSNSDATKVGASLFEDAKELTEVNMPNAKTIGQRAFYNCAKLQKVNLPKAETVGTYCFYGNAALESIDLPRVNALNSSAFSGCYALKSVNFPLLNSVSSGAFISSKIEEINFQGLTSAVSNSFEQCYSVASATLSRLKNAPSFLFGSSNNKLEIVRFGKLKSISQNAFRCSRLKSIIIMNYDQVCSLSNTNAFTGCYHFLGTVNSSYNPEGLKDGYIYVPKSLIEQYKVATNWSAFADQFRAVEDYPEIGKNLYKYSMKWYSSGSTVTRQTATINCNIGDLLVASVNDSSSFADVDGWTFVSKSQTYGALGLCWYYKFAESKQESITLTCNNINLFAFEGATGFIDNGFEKIDENSQECYVRKPKGAVLFAAASQNHAGGGTWTVCGEGVVVQPTATFKYLLNVLCQNDHDEIMLKGPVISNQTTAFAVGSLTIEGIDKFETWR